MRAISMAAIVGGLLATPVSAATITESFTVTVEPSAVPYDVVGPASVFARVGFPILLFDPSLGTLDTVSITLGGLISGASITENASVDFFLINQLGALAAQNDPVSTMMKVSLNATVDSVDLPVALDPFIGTGVGELDFAFGGDAPNNATLIESNGPLKGSITYDYTPNSLALTPSVPEPSTWAMMLVGFAGLAFAGSSARGGFLNRTRSAGLC